MNKFVKRGLVAVGALVTAGAAFAEGGIVVTGVVSEIAATAAPIAAIGGAVLTVMVGIKAYKWVRRAM